MRYEVTIAQKTYFESHKNLLLEDFFKESQTAEINKYSDEFDLWRNHPEIKKMSVSRELGEIIFQLTSTRPVQLIFDRIAKNETVDLTQTSFQGLVAGVLVFQRSILVFSPLIPIDLTEKALLIGYGELGSVFIRNETDPYASQTKRRGVNYGDSLNTDDYPLIYR